MPVLLECHERIRSFAATALRLARARGVPDEQIAEAARGVRGYFGTALPLHVEDEERSVLPRLRGLDAEVDRALDVMHGEHDAHARPLARLLDLCARLEAEPPRLGEVAPELEVLATTLSALFEEHLRNEEQVLFPAMGRLLPAEADAAILKELRARRAAPEAR